MPAAVKCVNSRKRILRLQNLNSIVSHPEEILHTRSFAVAALFIRPQDKLHAQLRISSSMARSPGQKFWFSEDFVILSLFKRSYLVFKKPLTPTSIIHRSGQLYSHPNFRVLVMTPTAWNSGIQQTPICNAIF